MSIACVLFRSRRVRLHHVPQRGLPPVGSSMIANHVLFGQDADELAGRSTLGPEPMRKRRKNCTASGKFRRLHKPALVTRACTSLASARLRN